MLSRFGVAARTIPIVSKSRLLLAPQHQFVRYFGRSDEFEDRFDGAYENERAFDLDGVSDSDGDAQQAAIDAATPDGPATDSDLEGDGERIYRLAQEASLPQYARDEVEEDAEEIRAELEFRQRKLADLDKVISEDWVLNHENGVYYNPTTGETKVPFEQSYEEYKLRRAARQRNRTIEDINSRVPDFITPENLHDQTQFYPEFEMRGIRDKYKHLNFKDLQSVLHKADSQFFQRAPAWSMMKWGVKYPSPSDASDAELQHELEHLRFLALLPHKFHVATMRVGHMTKLGKKMSVGVLVIGGTGNGYLGYGYGKGPSPAEAMKIASHDLRRNMLEIPLDEGRTIPFSVVGKFRKTKVIMQRCTRGRGIKGGPLMQAIYECAGLEDISSKITGSRLRNPMSIIQAIFQGFSQLVSPRAIAAFRGVNYYEEFVNPIREAPPTPEEMAKRTSKIREYIKDAEEQWARRPDLNRESEAQPEWNEQNYEDKEETAKPATEGAPAGEGEEATPVRKRRPRVKDTHALYHPWTLSRKTFPSRPKPRPGWFQGPELKRMD